MSNSVICTTKLTIIKFKSMVVSHQSKIFNPEKKKEEIFKL